MRQLFLLLAFTLAGTSLSAQNDAGASARAAFQNYSDLTVRQDVDGLLTYVYPGIYTLISQEQMKGVFEEMFGDDELRIRFSPMQIGQVSQAFVHEAEVYLKIDYINTFSMELAGAEYRDPEMVEMLQGTLSGIYGGGNLTYDEANYTFHIRLDESLLAISAEEKMQWTFVRFSGEGDDMAAQLLPDAVVEHFRGS